MPAGVRGAASRRAAAQTENGTKADAQVVVKIDNEGDPFATVVTVEFGDYLGELVDTASCNENSAEFLFLWRCRVVHPLALEHERICMTPNRELASNMPRL